MNTFNVPTREDVSTNNQAIFDNLNKGLGFVPNLYATYAHSDTALENYLNFANAKTSLSAKEKEVVNLAVSQVNDCIYCLSAHTAIGKMNGFSDEQILEFRAGFSSDNAKLNALAKLAKNITENRGKTDEAVLENFFNAGYTKGNLIDTISLVGDKTISNYVHSTTKVPVDFPVAQPLETETV
ncbi:carboxymuconolactone decarboxylase family protein [Winogradskyella echinorum]|uniref:Carboxymuconolactone decarboxylase family protein n=1 Tax=Winogradskyella echinorum TaxID=538189 RepID=A0ABR6XYN0_9FLAO|nr:carboxymuconolactone decarboxylase family protein [Winogradskyella echinorum]MBC3845580.1 carboxymuconolactone decarboxylase family protein [Winogradskyella echinorum]MBC5749928.1 carboxymuconolactone decarboxylase family protein [Winogradskyella echinorum]